MCLQNVDVDDTDNLLDDATKLMEEIKQKQDMIVSVTNFILTMIVKQYSKQIFCIQTGRDSFSCSRHEARKASVCLILIG